MNESLENIEENSLPNTIKDANANQVKKKKKRGFFFILFRFFLYLIMISGLFVTLATLEPNLRHYVLKKVLNLANKSLVGKVEIGDINFFNLKGIELKDIRVLSAGDTLLSSPSIILNLEFRKLLNNEIIIHNLEIQNPKVKLLAINDSTWNFDKIVKPSNDTSSSKSKLNIDIQNLLLINGDILVYNKYSTQKFNSNTINYSNLKIKNLNIDLKAYLDIKENNFSASIRNINFYELNNNLYLKKFDANALVSKNSLELLGGEIELNNSKLDINTSFTNFDLIPDKSNTNPIPFEKATLTASIIAKDLELNVLNKFVNLNPLTSSKLDLKANIKGNINKLQFKELNIKSGNTKLNLFGTLENIANGKPIKYYSDINNTSLNRYDLSNLLPSVDFSWMPSSGVINISNTKAHGENGKIYTNLNLSGTFGKIQGLADINLENSEPIYKFNIITSSLNLAEILKNSKFNTNLNSTIYFEGESFNPQKMKNSLAIILTPSTFNQKSILNGRLNVNNDGAGLFHLDTLKFFLPNEDSYKDIYSENQELSLKGKIDLSSYSNPKYNVFCKLDQINPAWIFDSKSYPTQLNGKFSLKGENFDLNKIELDFDSEFNSLMLSDRVLLPFKAKINLHNIDATKRKLNIESDFIDATITGKFNPEKLINFISGEVNKFSDFIKERINLTIPNDNSISKKLELSNPGKVSQYDEFDCSIKSKFKDFSLISFFLDSISLGAKGELDLDIKSHDQKAEFILKNVDLDYLKFKDKNANILTRELKLSGFFNSIIVDSINKLNEFKLELTAQNNIHVNDLVINDLKTNIILKDKQIDFSLINGINSQFDYLIQGSTKLNDESLNLKLNSFEFNLNGFKWKNSGLIELDFGNSQFAVNKFKMTRQGGEEITVQGLFDPNESTFEDMQINLTKVDIKDIFKLAGVKQNPKIGIFDGKINNAKITINGDFFNPNIQSKINGSDFSYSNQLIGSFDIDFKHIDSTIKSEIFFYKTDKFQHNDTTVNIKVKRFPFNLTFDNIDIANRFHSAEKVDIVSSLRNIPVKLAEPYAPAVSDFTGLGNLDLNFYGTYPDKITYYGNASFNNVSFLVDNTNIRYYGKGNLLINTSKVELNNVLIKNIASDNPNGSANLSGYIKLKGTDIDSLNIFATTKNILLMSDNSKRTFPNLFGEFRIATGNKPIHFYGTLKEPNLNGDVQILKGDLKMPIEDKAEHVVSSLQYEIKKTYRDTTKSKESNKNINDLVNNSKSNTGAIESQRYEPEKRFSDIINYDLNIFFPNSLKVEMDINTLIKVNAVLGTQDANIPVRFERKRNSDAKLLGTIELKDNSKMSFFKTFQTKGYMNFLTGDISNPNIDLVATFEGRTIGDAPKDYKVIIIVKGTKLIPEITYLYSLNGDLQGGDQSQIKQDITTLLTLGTTKDNRGSSGINNVTDDFTKTLTNGIINQGLNQALKNYGLIANLNLDLNKMENTKVEVGGLIFDKIPWFAGLNMTNGASSYETKLQIPGSLISENWKYYNAQGSWLNNTNTFQNKDQKNWEFKLKYNYSW